jgi:hypothetical protein
VRVEVVIRNLATDQHGFARIRRSLSLIPWAANEYNSPKK